jgi:phenylacetate-CoA ligase
MIVNEGLIVEIVRPGTNIAAPDGEIGEVVVTRVNPDYPLLRVSTGDLSRVIPGPSPCGRTGLRIAGWLGRVGEETRVANRVLTPQHVLDLGDRHACVRRMQIVVRREGQADSILLRAEGPDGDPQLPDNLRRNLLDITGIEGDIEVVPSGVLDSKARLIADERR